MRKTRVDELREFWKTFKHKIIWKDGYFKKVMIILLSLLLIDLIFLWGLYQ